MAYFSSELLTVTTAADGTATSFTANGYNGFLHSILYVIDGSNPYSNSVVITVTGETTGVTLWAQTVNPNASVQLFPRAATHSIAGVASLFTTGAAFAVTDKIPLAGERIKVVLSAGGNAKLGAFRFIVGD